MGDRTNLRTWLVVSIFLLGLVAGQVSADPNLIAHYTFDDDTADDSSGYSHHGTIVPGDVSTSISIVTDPERRKVLNVNNSAGVINSVVNCGGAGDWADIREQITIATWFTFESIHTGNIYMLTKGSTYQVTSNGISDGMRTYMGGLSSTNLTTSTSVMDGKWHHVTVTYDSTTSTRILYIDGQEASSDTPSGLLNVHTASFVIGGRLDGTFNMRGWDGRLDDVRLYNRGLSPGEITRLAGLNLNKAWFPYPEDEQEDISESSLTLTWRPGDNAAAIQGHKVYLGTDKSLVDSNDASVFQATRDVNNWPTGYLNYCKTYYWKVNEVNGVSEWPGIIWQFKTKDVKATVPHPVDGAEGVDVNVDLEWTAGDPWVTHSVYLSSDWNDVNERQLSAREATGLTDPNWRLENLLTDTLYHWCVDETDSNGTYPGDIWQFETKAAKATNPRPVDGAVYLPLEPVLSWSPGCYVADSNGHDVYLGTDYAAVADANHNSDEFLGNFDVNSCSLDCLKARITYYWVVDEVNGPNTWPGNIWSFTTGTEGYYCNLFMDGGKNLTSRTTLPAAALLGLSMEYIATGDADETLKIMVETDDGDWQDDNGVLLYPDGEPRFQCFYSNGGQSIDHGATLGEDGRQRIRDFYANGGSYTGSCAGSALPTIRVTSTGDPSYREEYYHIWPARGHYTQLAASYTGHDVPIDSPLLDYYDFGGDYYIASVRHNGGNYTIEDDSFYWCTGTEVLTTFAEPIVGDDASYQDFMGHVSSWAYKEDANSGRLCPCGSHPESIESGEQRDMMAAFLQYAMAGNGDPTVKAALENGVTRQMNDNSTTGHEKVGDKQYHHFTIQIPSGMKLTITLDGLGDVNDLDLFARKDDFALRGETDLYEASNTSNSDETLTINDPCAGTWYIGVKGAKTVTKTKETNYYRYTGNLGLLNGVAYTITAEWHMLGDFAEDYGVDSVDFSVLALTWQKGQGQAGYDPNCDISIPADNLIDEKDLKIFTNNWLAGK